MRFGLGLLPTLCVALSSPPPRATRREALTLATTTAAGIALPPTPAYATPAKEKLILPKLGLGAWAWGDTLFWGYDAKKDDELSDVFDYAVSKGVTFFDTAEVYGLGRSETLLGQFAAKSPKADSIEVATKFAALPWRTKPGDVLEAAKKSTERLGRPIDLYQIHFPNAWANEAYWEGLGQCVDQGLVKAAGVSNYGVDAMKACSATLSKYGVPLTSNQIQLSLIYPYALSNGLMDTCKDLGVQVLAYSPLGLGLLTGKFSPDNLPSGPRKLIAEQALSDPGFLSLVGTMREIGTTGHSGASPAQIALAWCTAKAATVIPGARTVSQAESNIAAANLNLSAEEVRRLDDAAAKVKPVLSPETSPFPKKDVRTGLVMYDS